MVDVVDVSLSSSSMTHLYLGSSPLSRAPTCPIVGNLPQLRTLHIPYVRDAEVKLVSGLACFLRSQPFKLCRAFYANTLPFGPEPSS